MTDAEHAAYLETLERERKPGETLADVERSWAKSPFLGAPQRTKGPDGDECISCGYERKDHADNGDCPGPPIWRLAEVSKP